jgi:hypothetical protein
MELKEMHLSMDLRSLSYHFSRFVDAVDPHTIIGAASVNGHASGEVIIKTATRSMKNSSSRPSEVQNWSKVLKVRCEFS